MLTQNGRFLRRLCLDYSNPRDWNKDKLICKDVNVKSAWLSGYNRALSELLILNIDLEQAHTLARQGITLRRPISSGHIVGVNELDEDWSNPEENRHGHIDEEMEVEDAVQDQEDQEESLAELAAYNHKHVPYFLDENGGRIYKTTCLKKNYNSEPLSQDRLRRIRGLTTFPGQLSDGW